MNNPRSDKKQSKMKKSKRRFSKLTSLIIPGAVIVALIGIAAIIFFKSSNNFGVSAQSREASQKYKATRNIIVDKETGQARKPNAEEIKELVDTLQTMTKRDENLESAPAVNGGVSLDLDGGFGGTILARPNSDGTMETRCVFTFQEAIDFLGLVEENS